MVFANAVISGLLHLKPVCHLWKVYCKSFTEGVRFSHGLACWETIWNSLTPSVQHQHVYLPQREYTFHVEVSSELYSTWHWYFLCKKLTVNLPQGGGTVNFKCSIIAHCAWTGLNDIYVCHNHFWNMLMSTDFAEFSKKWLPKN